MNAFPRLALLAGLALLLAALPPTHASAPDAAGSQVLAAPLASSGPPVARCTGTAPVQTSCTTTVTAAFSSNVGVATGGTFTGEIVCTLRGADATYRIYYLEIVGGIAYGAGWTGTSLSPGVITMQCTTDGLFGTAGYTTGARYLGVGTWDVSFRFT